MPWCITCGKNVISFMKGGWVFRHKKIGWIRYLKRKLHGHRCYI